MAVTPISEVDSRLADTLIESGDIDAALALLLPPGDERWWDPGRAWRVGLVHYLLIGSPREALDHLRRGTLATETTADEALLLGWLASAHWALGDSESCATFALRAMTAAEASGDSRALAAANVALALRAMLAGDRVRNGAHYAKALALAQIAGDTLQLIRVRTNRSSHFMDEACVADALADLRIARELAEGVGNKVLLALALTNEGYALDRLGRLVEAEETFRQVIQLCQQTNSSKVCFGLLGLGDVHRRRGQPALARAAYEEVIPLAEEHGHIQVLVPALAGLAIVMAGHDAAAAQALAKRALAEAVGPFTTVALLAVCQVTLAGEKDRAVAGQLAEEAQRSARAHRDRSGVAQALELQAQCCDEWERAAGYLVEARSIWNDVGAVVDADRVTVALGQSPDSFSDYDSAAERLAAAGIAFQKPQASGGTPGVAIRTLGRFEVVVGGKLVPQSAWQSRKARDLLRLLVARRGRPATRDELADVLWAEEESATAARRAHRLAVALSIVRGVLDTGRQSAADSVVIADGSSISLDITRLVIDLETFVRQADHGLRLYRLGRGGEGRSVLAAAEQLYKGDFLEDEPYEDWTSTPRELARATYLRVGRTLASSALETGETDEAIHYLLRILAMDGYDEQSHLDLIECFSAAGRHGEARRASERYTVAMQKIGVPAQVRDGQGLDHPVG